MMTSSEKMAVFTPAHIEQYQGLLTAKGRSANTVKAYGSDWRSFLSSMGDNLNGTLTLSVKDFDILAVTHLNLMRKEAASRSVIRRRSSLMTLSKLIGVSVPLLSDYNTPKGSKLIAHPLPEGMDGVRRMISVASSVEAQTMIALCGLGGLRISEARSVMPKDISIRDSTVFVRGKGDRDRTVPMSGELQEWVVPLLAERMIESDNTLIRLKDRQARELVTQAGMRAGISRRVASHDLRSTFATAVLDKTGNIRLVQELLGHASVTTTELYTLVGNDSLKKAVELP